MDERDVGYDILDFVGLQMSYEVPLDIGWQDLVFISHLEGLVFAEISLSCIVGLLNHAGWLGFGHSDKTYTLRNKRAYVLDILCDVSHDMLIC